MRAERGRRRIRQIASRLKIDVILSANILPSFAANFSGAPVVLDYLDHLEESASVYYPGSALGEVVKQVVRRINPVQPPPCLIGDHRY